MNKITLSAPLLSILIFTTTLSNNINYNAVVTHFYYIKRLAKSAYCLSLLHKQHYCYRPCNISKQKECIHIDSVSFFHHRIISCIDTMLLTGSLKALLLLLHDMKLYRYLQDQQFIHELFLLIFTVHKQILLHECDKDTAHSLKTITLNNILEISEKINQLPIA